MTAEVSELEKIAAFKPETTADERTWAAIAHASTVVTLVLALASAGILGLFFVFVPLIIYFSYKDRSEYVAYHAAQAFAMQVLGSLGYFTAILLGVVLITLAWVITGVLSVILIGLILIPVAIVLTVAVVLALVGVPFLMGGYSFVAAIQTANGDNYKYPYLGQWVEDWLARTHEKPAPLV